MIDLIPEDEVIDKNKNELTKINIDVDIISTINNMPIDELRNYKTKRNVKYERKEEK